MLKALIKKQLMELNAWFYQDKKTGKNRSKAGIVAYAVIYAVLFLVFFGMFFYLSNTLCALTASMEMDWLYHAIMCLIALTIGVFGSVFSTFSTLYKAKDNELLLAFPIPVSQILLVRLFGVWLWGLIYEMLALLPAMVVYWINVDHSPLVVVLDVGVILILSLLILALSCVLGWIVAKISGRLRHKSLFTVLASLLFLGVYLYVYSQAYEMLQQVLIYIQSVGEKIKGAIYPLYLLGQGAAGNIGAFLLTAALILVLSALVWLVLARTFLKLATTQNDTAKRTYRETTAKAKSASKALLRKEGQRFLSSPNYMLNCGMGTVMMVVLTVLMLLNRGQIQETVAWVFVGYEEILPLLACGLLCIAAGMNDLTAPSVSLEGKSLWIAQSLPVPAWQVLKAKLKLHLLVTLPPVVLCGSCLALVLGLKGVTTAMVLVVSALFVLVIAAFGLMINLKAPNFTWTSETAVIKQSMGVMLALFSGWILVLALGGVYAIFSRFLSAEGFLVLCAILLTGLSAILLHWLKTRGVRIFETL